MAEAHQTVIVIPVVLEIAEVEFVVAVRVPVDVRHPVAAIGVYALNCPNHRKRRLPPSEFYAEPAAP